VVNTTSTQKDLTLTFHNSRTHNDETRDITLTANQHRVFNIANDFFDNQVQPDISSAVITNAGGVIGLELFGSLGWGSQLEGILLTGHTSSTLYYPHIGDDNWWTGIVAYNTLTTECPITVTPYDVDGGSLSPVIPDPITGNGRYVDVVSNLGLPTETAWFRIDSDPTCRLSGFELFGTVVGNQLGAYAGGAGANAGIFAKIETDGWTGIAFVNTGDNDANVTLTAYYDTGGVAATEILNVRGHAKKVDSPENIFTQDITGATYIAYTSNSNVVGFQAQRQPGQYDA
jgi:hypothetical protein